MFRLRTPQQLLTSSIAGYHLLILSRDRERTYLGLLSGVPFIFSETPLYLIYLVGAGLFLAGRQREALLWPLLLLNVIPFTATIRMPPRIFAPLAPYLQLMVAMGFWTLIVAVYRVGRALQSMETGPREPVEASQ